MSTEYYAYQIALKTLKERCDRLQNKLDTVEEENNQLKIQLCQDVRRSSETSADADQLRFQVALLTEQKSKLNHQVQIITSENQKLWTRLSKLASGNDNFGNTLSLVDDPLQCVEGSVSYSENHSDLEMSKVALTPEDSQESLEEVSLKLNAIIMEKRGIPVEFPNTIDMYTYKNPLQIENFAFSSSDNVAPVLNSFKSHVSKLKQFKQILQNNKNDLTSAITLFKNFQKNNLCSECGKTFGMNCNTNSGYKTKVVGVEDEIGDMSTLPVGESEVSRNEYESSMVEKICPLCGATLTGLFKELTDHVNGHFDDIDVGHNFELLP